jgi:hypothetical protein
MSEPDHADGEPIEELDGEEGATILADPDDYHEAQRLREIHEARRHVHKVHRDLDHYTASKNHTRQRASLAGAVSAYIYELLPLLKAADVDISLPDGMPWPDLEHFAVAGGSIPDENDYAGYKMSMAVFNQTNGALAELKPLISEEENDTWDV